MLRALRSAGVLRTSRRLGPGAHAHSVIIPNVRLYALELLEYILSAACLLRPRRRRVRNLRHIFEQPVKLLLHGAQRLWVVFMRLSNDGQEVMDGTGVCVRPFL